MPSNLMEIIFHLCGLLLFIFLFIKTAKKSKPMKLPPGPRTLPIIGNLHQLSGPLLHHLLADLAKKYGPLMHLKLGEVSTMVISSPEVAKEVMNDQDVIFAHRPYTLAAKILLYNCSDITFSPHGDYWRQLRKICTVELLSAKRVQAFRSIREEEVLNMIRSLSLHKGSAANISKLLFSLTYSIIAQAAFGKKTEYQDEFVRLMEDVMQLAGGFCIADIYPSVKILEVISGMRQKLQKAQKKIDRIMATILNEHKEESRKSRSKEAKDLVDVLLDIQSSGNFGVPLSDDNIKAVILGIFSAGVETSATSVWAMSEMIKNPRVLRRAQEEVRKVFGDQGNVDESSSLHELKYLQAVIKETLRMHPAAPLLVPRECSEQCKVYGYDIPAKARVFINFSAIGRDPMHWIEPDKFNPERFLDSEFDFRGTYFSYIPFGGGRRICPGISFAQPVLELPLAQLLYHFDWKLPGELQPEQLDMTERFGVTVGRENDLELIPIPYSRSYLPIRTPSYVDK